MASNSISRSLELLSELSRKTTVYHDAPADRVEDARLEYMEALRNYYSAQQLTNGVGAGGYTNEFEDSW